ncbi:helical backbone metal receptor [Alteromonas oceanisediminis]|uniref:helical backbone metal receptor n=1 Tax=Alteromonas oceanisediminis TaxID=2836180 RepID=UPI001BDB6AC5|nr:helical backbone metal receptor [Alteromonas oceanisediminis]MBT0585236.1 ABC transporter substrate-binding protein [Alteromonas oceanisediminis]
MHWFITVLALNTLLCFVAVAHAGERQRIITLAPHLTEWVYLLGAQDDIVGVSAFSDVPAQAAEHPVIADANGVNFRQILKLKPSIILAWEGGNKPQDLTRLESLGFTLFHSSVKTPQDIARELRELGRLLSKQSRAEALADEFITTLNAIDAKFSRAQAKFLHPVLFYLSTTPMMSIGEHAWANQVLRYCGAETIFTDAPTDYPEVRVTEVLRRQPVALITPIDASPAQLALFWTPHQKVLNAPIIAVEGDIIHRFTPRLTQILPHLCTRIHAAAAAD